ncbi:MAG TPA: SAM-dependent methyltransferase [Methylophilaceae bacterium]|nr:SAM-dependent methyltransferase [Methylophilaceae bacterium]
MTPLPIPGAEALRHSQSLVAHIREEIARSGGWIDFAHYMQLALYAPGLGYYSGGAEKFGPAGDFVTAPELSPLFGQCLARQAAQVCAQARGDILELGAGTGRLAAELLLELQRLGQLPAHYLILEVSAFLQDIQRQTLMAQLPPDLFARVAWLDHLPSGFDGFVLANEVLDALPVHIVGQREHGFERGVTCEGDALVWADRHPLSPTLNALAAPLTLPGGYLTELCPLAGALVASIAQSLRRGVLLFIDYGFPRREYYHPQRDHGTLMCHYRHHAHGDPFLYPGLQDITAHVDFTSAAEAGVANGLRLAGYTTQAQFLINCGITELLAQMAPGSAAYLRLASQAQKLLSPAEMGELFKVLALSKDQDATLLGFVHGDKSHTL